MRSECFIGAHVYRRHEPARLVGPDWEQGQARRPKPLENLREMVAEPRVPREIDDSALAADDIAAPEGFIAVENPPGRETPRER